MGNYSIGVRTKRWGKFLLNYAKERAHGLDFSMVYVGDIQENTAEFHGYSMTDEGDMKRMLRAVPVQPEKCAFLDVGCGKGMCMKCAAESGYRQVAGLDLDSHLLEIARRNMAKLSIPAQCIQANATEFGHYNDYDVFCFYNPFGRSVFEQVIEKLKESQGQRDRDIWVVYYHPVFAELFDLAGFILCDEVHDSTRDTTARFYLYPKQGQICLKNANCS